MVTGCRNTGLSQVTVAELPVAEMSPGQLETIGGISTVKRELKIEIIISKIVDDSFKKDILIISELFTLSIF